MKLRTGLWMVVIASSALWAQNAQPSAPAASSSTKPAPAAKSATASTAATAKPATAKTTAKTKKKSSNAAAAPKANVATNVATAKPKHAVGPGKRDPFVSPVQTQTNGPINCGTGKRCLVLDQTKLEGIVKAPNGMIAVVSNNANKAYFLRENDPVYNGYVMRITPDSVVFQETITDRLGKKSTREVVKKVNAPAV